MLVGSNEEEEKFLMIRLASVDGRRVVDKYGARRTAERLRRCDTGTVALPALIAIAMDELGPHAFVKLVEESGDAGAAYWALYRLQRFDERKLRQPATFAAMSGMRDACLAALGKRRPQRLRDIVSIVRELPERAEVDIRALRRTLMMWRFTPRHRRQLAGVIAESRDWPTIRSAIDGLEKSLSHQCIRQLRWVYSHKLYERFPEMAANTA